MEVTWKFLLAIVQALVWQIENLPKNSKNIQSRRLIVVTAEQINRFKMYKCIILLQSKHHLSYELIHSLLLKI